MDLNLPRWQRYVWTLLWSFSAGFAVASYVYDRVTGRKP